jgi:hypothetical protein
MDFKTLKSSLISFVLAPLKEEEKKSRIPSSKKLKIWFFIRIYVPYIFSFLFVIFMIVALTGWNTIEGHLVLGSILSLGMSLLVALSYVMVIPWRKHPSALVLYKSLTSVLFSLNMIFQSISTNSSSCRNYAVVTHIALLAGECWLTTIALDLVNSLTNPFISYKSSLKRYQAMVWTFTAFISFIFYNDQRCQGRFDQGVCWVIITSTTSPCLWGYYLFWVLCMYAYQIYAAVFAHLRLSKGLQATFAIRAKCASDTFVILRTYAAYLVIIMIMFVIIASNSYVAPGSAMANFALFFLFIIANRGSVDGIVWFMLHDFRTPLVVLSAGPEEKGGDIKALPAIIEARAYERIESGDVDDISSSDVLVESAAQQMNSSTSASSMLHSSANHRTSMGLLGLENTTAGEALLGVTDDIVHKGEIVQEKLLKTVTKLADLAIEEYDETDMSPQVMVADSE